MQHINIFGVKPVSASAPCLYNTDKYPELLQSTDKRCEANMVMYTESMVQATTSKQSAAHMAWYLKHHPSLSKYLASTGVQAYSKSHLGHAIVYPQ